jgi:uncharacterized protein YgiM (DUF1202 family)
MKKSANSCSLRRLFPIVSAALVCAVLWSTQPVRADAGPSIQPVAAPMATTGHGTVKGDRCNVRSRPSTSSEVVAQLHKGDAVEVLERKTSEHGKPAEWLRISLPATAKCYVSAKHLSDGAADADNLNVRCGPGGNYRDIGKLPKGTKVDVIETKGEWTQIKPTPQCSGWIAGELVDVEPAATPAVTAPPSTPSVNMPEVVTPPAAAPVLSSASPAPSVSIVNIDPDVAVAYVVKDGYLYAVTEPNAPAVYELRTREVDRLSFRMAYLESTEANLKKFEGKHVRITGNQRWRKGERYPVIAIERIDIVL